MAEGLVEELEEAKVELAPLAAPLAVGWAAAAPPVVATPVAVRTLRASHTIRNASGHR